MKISLSLLQQLFGYCPQCGAPVSRRIDNTDQCANGHIYPSDETIAPSDNHFDVGQKVLVRPRRRGANLLGVVVDVKNSNGLIAVQIDKDLSNQEVGGFVGYYKKDRLQKR